MANFRFRIQHNSGPSQYDRSYSQLRVAKAILTKQVRQFRSYSWCILDQETGKRYSYNEITHKVEEIIENI